ncbi:polysaccharide biosynthesis tyrosine autokinase [Nakamurella deserti]|uniref:polysaccharide biosynthesis tyrosine autokinase n=1 Tax=Nakamurella deserti TaxID=2164074 RepID=UPI000DBE1C72|nr:polysaccharide biosynthesis tyrosine autokinase [Nakamurella deserti]
MDLQAYFRIIRKNWWVIALLAVLGVGAATAYNETSTPRFESDVTFYVSTPTDAAGGNAFQANQYAVAKIESYNKLVKSDALAERLIARTGLDLSPSEVAGMLSAASDLNTVLITVTVVDSSRDRSLQLADAVAQEFGPLIDGLDNRTSEEGVQGSTVKMVVTSGPTLNPDPVSPRKTVNLALGLLAGLVLGFVLATIRGLTDTTLRTIDALRTASGLPVLGAVGLDSGAKKSPVLIGDQIRSIRAENYRQIRTNLQFMDVDKPVQVLVVTSSVASEGKSSTAVNLAIVSAETGRRVLLIEADLRRPRAADYLGLERAVGLSNVLAGQVAVQDVLQPWGTDGLMVLPSGSVPPNPSEMLGSQNMVNLLAELRTLFDLVIIDTPPLLPVTDGAVAATLADGVVVVVRYGKTTRNQVNASLYSLEAVDARILGCVLSMVPRKGAAATGYDGYGYYEDDPTKRAAPLEPMSAPTLTPISSARTSPAATQPGGSDKASSRHAAGSGSSRK